MATRASRSRCRFTPKRPVTLLNVSYDPTRELYQDVNAAFAAAWKAKTGQAVTINQSHGGSGKQARAVIDGLAGRRRDARAGLRHRRDPEKRATAREGLAGAPAAQQHARTRRPSCLLVRKGNPKGIKDWDDLVRPGVSVITPNPKTSGGARWNYLAAWGYALKQSEWRRGARRATSCPSSIDNVPVLDSGARGSTTTFVQRGIGDVLVAWENEALLAVEKLGKGDFEIDRALGVGAGRAAGRGGRQGRRPSRGTREGRGGVSRIPVHARRARRSRRRNYYRPAIRDGPREICESSSRTLQLFTVDEVFGGWAKAQKTHFADGGVFDQIYQPGT